MPTDKYRTRTMKSDLRTTLAKLQDGVLSIILIVEKVKTTIKFVKNRKIVGIDGIYPEFIKHMRPKAIL